MAKALRRILRFRHLAEEEARLQVERAAQLARQASAACERQTLLVHEQRSTLADSWISRENEGRKNKGREGDSEPKGEHGWLMEEAVLEFSGWKRMRLEQLREAELLRMKPLVERYTERRRELRQTEQLLEQQAAVEAMERDRRAQAATDEWFLQRSLTRRSRSQQKVKPDATTNELS